MAGDVVLSVYRRAVDTGDCGPAINPRRHEVRIQDKFKSPRIGLCVAGIGQLDFFFRLVVTCSGRGRRVRPTHRQTSRRFGIGSHDHGWQKRRDYDRDTWVDLQRREIIVQIPNVLQIDQCLMAGRRFTSHGREDSRYYNTLSIFCATPLWKGTKKTIRSFLETALVFVFRQSPGGIRIVL